MCALNKRQPKRAFWVLDSQHVARVCGGHSANKGKGMYFIASFGFLMMLLSLSMVVKPDSFSNGIISFSEKSYFHLFEIISRITAGIIFVAYAANTIFPKTILCIGYGLILVGIGLALTPPTLHRKFAVWSANNFRSKFRLIGIVSVPLSMFLIYAATGAVFT